MSPLVAAGIGTALCCACSAKPSGPEGTRAERLVRLDDISRKCGLPKSIFKLVGTDELHIQPSPDEKYERVDCALSELRKSDLPLKIGFVGNEVYPTENRQ